jgi:conjugative transfer signal peptidase TraF
MVTWKNSSTRAGLNRLGRAGIVFPTVGGALAVACGLAAWCGIRINTSYSLPMGLYIRTTDRRATLIEFCPEGRYAEESSSRGYRTNGFCPDGAVPLLKPVVATPGDTVEMSDRGIAVNGHLLPDTGPVARDSLGRSLQPWPNGRYVVGEGTVWVASSYNRASYDSRYMGPIPTRLIRARLKPLWTF